MATSTAGKHATVQAVATPPASTPFSSNHHSHLAITPHGAQSVVPSPQQIKKSPATSLVLLNQGTTGSFGAGYDSPSAAMALGGISNLSDLNFDGLCGVSSLKRDDEEERKRKLDLVSEILKQNPGRVSESGIERLARSIGFECLWEPNIVSESSSRTLIIAGSTLALDIEIDSNVVKSVSLTFPDSPEIVTRHTERANQILLFDLILQKNESPLTKMLDRFSRNLRSLATSDKLSVLPNLNCHEAIAGVFESLNRLYKWENDKLKHTGVKNFEKVIMCSKSGRPIMHTRGRLGLSLDYWQNLWKIETEKEGLTWSILIECDTMSGLVYTPLRVSCNWISTEIEKPNPPDEELMMGQENLSALDWLEPENTLVSATESGTMNNLGHSSNQNYPEVIFVAKFDPPLIVPGCVAAQIYDSLQATLDIYQTTTYDGLMFPHNVVEKISIDSRSIVKDIKVPTLSKTGEKIIKIHKVALHFEKIDYGRTLTTLPFSHPRQIIQILPVLRQYALMSRLLLNLSDCRCVPQTSQSSEIKEVEQQNNWVKFETFMSNKLTLGETPMKVDILVSTQPFPRLRVLFPFRDRIADIHTEIKLNGLVELISQNILPDDGSKLSTGKIFTVSDLGRILEITENFGIWIEYIKKLLE